MVNAKSWESMSVSWNLNMFSGPKGTLQCGKCLCHSTVRIPVVNYPIIPCPLCGTPNKIPIIFE